MNQKSKKQIIAIGGVGFTKKGQDEASISSDLIHKYFLEQTQTRSPRICFIPTASGEDQKYIISFYQTFATYDCKPVHLSLFDPPTSDLESFILGFDAIFVGGGNTKSMLALWREWKLDHILKKAWEQGTLLGGSSAGALCWFEEGITDSIPGPLTAISCLGFLKGSFCPHYDSEKERKPTYMRMLRDGMKAGMAADDYVALHYIGDTLEKIVCASDTGCGYHVHCMDGHLVEKKIKPIRLQ